MTRSETALIYKMSPKGRNVYLIWDDGVMDICGPYQIADLNLIDDPNDVLKELCSK